MSNFIVVYDACVLYSAPLRDLLVELATTGLFRARWTNEIHDEWVRSVLENRPSTSIEKLERTKQLMNHTVLDSLVTGYEALIEVINLPDPNDRHVLAAAIHCGASSKLSGKMLDKKIKLTEENSLYYTYKVRNNRLFKKTAKV